MSEKIRITTLVDDTSSNSKLLAEHGWALWIEYGKHKILFDTGPGNVIQTNAAQLGIDLSETDAIVLSHGHYDHTGGLIQVLDAAPQTKVYLHPEAVKPKFSCYGNQSCHSIGMPTKAAQSMREHSSAQNIAWMKEPREIFPGLVATGSIRQLTEYEDVGGPFYLDALGTQPDPLLDDQALFFESNQGLVVILGCAHAGVVNTLHHIMDLSGQKRFFTVLGGMHLGSASPERIARTIDAFRFHDVARLGPAHCTGKKAITQLWKAFPDRCFSCAGGTQLEFD
jgi:7,8-dihydropterin-6-yl-methyl-4-(beta-D-ribofuranosyl)aminobenzene 5'-phosphate synthase